jgi:hypothetical protein
LVGSVITAENDPLLIDVAFGSLSPGDRLEAMTALGQTSSFVAAASNGREAPIPAIRGTEIERQGSTQAV